MVTLAETAAAVPLSPAMTIRARVLRRPAADRPWLCTPRERGLDGLPSYCFWKLI